MKISKEDILQIVKEEIEKLVEGKRTTLEIPLRDKPKVSKLMKSLRLKPGKDWTTRFMGMITLSGFMGYIFLVTLQPPEQNSEALINLVLGYLGGLASAIISFYFGASHTSDKGD